MCVGNRDNCQFWLGDQSSPDSGLEPFGFNGHNYPHLTTNQSPAPVLLVQRPKVLSLYHSNEARKHLVQHHQSGTFPFLVP